MLWELVRCVLDWYCFRWCCIGRGAVGFEVCRCWARRLGTCGWRPPQVPARRAKRPLHAWTTMATHSGNTSDSSVSDRATFGKRSRKEPTPSAFAFGAPSETPSPYSFASTEHSPWLPPATMLQGDLKGLLRSRDSWDGERSLPLTPRSPSPTFSPTASPKRQCAEPPPGALSALATEDDLESRAAALGLTEATQRAWRETVIPPTPPSPSPTFSLPSSPKRRDGESRATADQFAAAQSFKTTATLVAERLEQGGASRSPNLTMPPWETSDTMPPPNAPTVVERPWLGWGGGGGVRVRVRVRARARRAHPCRNQAGCGLGASTKRPYR